MTNVATSLKPLTPIARTNLYENTLYKWHDHTKPGCFVMGLAEEGRNVLTMVCNKADQQWYNTLNASWIYDEDGHITNAATGLSLAIVGNDGADNIDWSVHLVNDSYCKYFKFETNTPVVYSTRSQILTKNILLNRYVGI